MPPQFDLYVRGSTWLHGLDPRVKLAFVLETSVLLFVWPSVWSATAGIALCGLLLWSARVPGTQAVRVVRTMGPVMTLVFAVTALFTPPGSESQWLRLGPLAVTPGSVAFGVMLALRLLALALIISLWLFTTDQATMVRGFLGLRLPYSWGLTLALALRYLPVFAGLFEQVREAQQARGLDLEQGNIWRRLRLHRPVLISMIILAVRQSEQLGWALEARALGAPGVRRSVYRPLRMQPPDWLALATILVTFAAALALRVP
jgi:energy-coupling factor transport system permease protein